MRALAANDCDLRPVDLVETQHVAAHPSIFPSAPSGLSHFLRWSRGPLWSGLWHALSAHQEPPPVSAFIGPSPRPQPAETVRSTWPLEGKDSPGFREPTADSLRSFPLDAPRAELGSPVGKRMARSTTSS